MKSRHPKFIELMDIYYYYMLGLYVVLLFAGQLVYDYLLKK